MKLGELIQNLEDIVKDHPEYLDLDVVYSSDDEGNFYRYVYYSPSVGFYDEENKEFSNSTSGLWNRLEPKKVICVN